MPVMDGLEATRRLRANPRHDALPVVAMTANAMPSDRESCLQAGMNDFVAKPVDPDLLMDALRRWMPDHARVGEPAAAAGPPPSLPTLAGVDTASGLRYAGGDEARYLARLVRFAAEHAGDGGRVAAWLAAGDRDSATRLVHTIKGLAGTLGLGALAREAQALEAALAQGGGGSPDTAGFAAALAQGCGAIAEALPSPDTPAPAVAPAPSKLLDHLEALLAADDADAAELHRQQAAAIAAAVPAAAAAIGKAIRSFDFPAALSALRAARQEKTDGPR